MKIGFVVNPIAGLGGTVALKGTDNLVDEALKLGAKPVSPIRAKYFLQRLSSFGSGDLKMNISFLVPEEPMGSQLFKGLDFKFEIIPLNSEKGMTTAEDTIKVITIFEQRQVDLIIFVGGDGTSIDVGRTIKHKTPVLGIPSGVKTYGSVFSHTPEEAVIILESFFVHKTTNEAELLDLDENLYKQGILSISLQGLVLIPAVPDYFQHAKERVESSGSEYIALQGIAEEIKDLLESTKTKKLIIIGPGSTFTPLSKLFSISRSVLGVDCIEMSESGNYSMIARDAKESDIFQLLDKYSETFILLTPIGGMGYLLGRGNHQLSPRILRKVPKKNILVACSTQKFNTIKEKVLRIDTVDNDFNNSMIGFIRVITNSGEITMVKIIH